MAGPAVLLLGFAVTGRPGAGSVLLASLTVAAAVGGPLVEGLAFPQPTHANATKADTPRKRWGPKWRFIMTASWFIADCGFVPSGTPKQLLEVMHRSGGGVAFGTLHQLGDER